jgi:hypothetical protein
MRPAGRKLRSPGATGACVYCTGGARRAAARAAIAERRSRPVSLIRWCLRRFRTIERLAPIGKLEGIPGFQAGNQKRSPEPAIQGKPSDRDAKGIVRLALELAACWRAWKIVVVACYALAIEGCHAYACRQGDAACTSEQALVPDARAHPVPAATLACTAHAHPPKSLRQRLARFSRGEKSPSRHEAFALLPTE